MSEEKLFSEQQQEDYEIDTLTNDRLLNDHEYDGIRELDNAPPSWFNLLFIGTIAFAFFYLYILWMFKPEGLVQEKEFAREMARTELAMSTDASQSESSLVLLSDQDALESGRKIFNDICAVCHLADGGGLVGPNLTDNYWIHGNTIEDLFRVTTEGVIEKG